MIKIQIILLGFLVCFAQQKKEINHIHEKNKIPPTIQNIPENLSQEYVINRNVEQDCDPNRLIPQMETLGSGFHLVSLIEYASVFQHSCSKNKQSINGKWQYLDNVGVVQDQELKFQSSSFLATNVEEFQESYNFQFYLSTENEIQRRNILNSAGTWNLQKQKQRENVQSEKYVYEYTQLSQEEYPSLNPSILKALRELPIKYDYEKYEAFCNQYGTHFCYRKDLGAKISQEAQTTSTYKSRYSDDEIKINFEVQFLNNVLSKNLQIPDVHFGFKKGTSSFDKFQAQTEFGEITIKGGIEANKEQNFISSVIKNPAAINCMYANMTYLFKNQYQIENAKIKREIMSKFLEDYLINSKGCTDEKAINFKKNATISDQSCIYSSFLGFKTTVYNCKYQVENTVPQCYDKYDYVQVSSEFISERDEKSNCKINLYACVLKQDYINNINIDIKNLDVLYIQRKCFHNKDGNFYYSILPEKQQYLFCPVGFVEINMIDPSLGLQLDEDVFLTDYCIISLCLSQQKKYIYGAFTEISVGCESDKKIKQKFTDFLNNPFTFNQTCSDNYQKYPTHSVFFTSKCSITQYLCIKNQPLTIQMNEKDQCIAEYISFDSSEERFYYNAIIFIFFATIFIILSCLTVFVGINHKIESKDEKIFFFFIFIIFNFLYSLTKLIFIDYEKQFRIWHTWSWIFTILSLILGIIIAK